MTNIKVMSASSSTTEKNIKTRIQQKHDTAANWAKATNFVPKSGEVIVYDADYNSSTNPAGENRPRIKIGNGTDNVNTLPFVDVNIRTGAFNGSLFYTDTSFQHPLTAQENVLYIDTFVTGNPIYIFDKEHNTFNRCGSTVPLYQHVINATAQDGYFTAVIISSNNLEVDSLTDLKALLGDTFEYPVSGGYISNITAIWKINQEVAIDNDDPQTTISLSQFTFTDTVTTIIQGEGEGAVTIDSSLSTTSTNPVQNKIITTALQDYQKSMHFYHLGSVNYSNVGDPVEYIQLNNGTKCVVHYPYKQLANAKVVSFGSGKPNTSIKLSSIVGQATMDYAGETEDTDSLPSDAEAIFEVYFDCWFYGTGSANVYIKSNLYGNSSDANSRQALVSGYSRFGQNAFIMPISKNGSITVSADASVTSGSMSIYGYRRIR